MTALTPPKHTVVSVAPACSVILPTTALESCVAFAGGIAVTVCNGAAQCKTPCVQQWLQSIWHSLWAYEQHAPCRLPGGPWAGHPLMSPIDEGTRSETALRLPAAMLAACQRGQHQRGSKSSMDRLYVNICLQLETATQLHAMCQ